MWCIFSSTQKPLNETSSMKKISPLVFFFLVIFWNVLRIPLPAQTMPPRTPVNLDFEQAGTGPIPPGWMGSPFNPQNQYQARISDQQPQQGDQCATVVSTGTPGPSDFGNLMQSVDATPYRDKQIRLRAFVRVEPASPGSRAQLWLRVDRPNREMGFFDNMDDRPITSAKWQFYEITGEVEPDATVVNFGLLLVGQGTQIHRLGRDWIWEQGF